ncbi:hypothetical protein EV426DRAFT_631296 [Tirmania nivea]|nr:hypothetical protein EV426DRAFT_631296 [Tirmania nivea]
MSSTKPPPFPVITLHTDKQNIPITIPSHFFPQSSQNDQDPPLQHLQPRSLTHPLLTHPPFQSWLNTLTHSLSLQKTSKNHPFHSDPYELKSIKVNHINYFGSGEKARIGFVSMDAEIKNSAGESLPGVVFLRGGAVAVLVIVEEDEREGEGEGEGNREQWTILTSQPRIPVGALRFLEIPAGMIDSAGKVTGKAAAEIKEELGITIDAEKLIDLCALTEQMTRGTEGHGDAGTGVAEEKMEVGMYPSAGGSDEFIKLYAYVHRVGTGGVKELEGKVGGLREERERIVLRVVRLRDLWKVAGRDAKALGAWAMWQGLKEAGMI